MSGAAYLAADGYESQLRDELRRAGVTVSARHGRLLRTEQPARTMAWAANIWFDPAEITIASIGDGARALRAMQRNWAMYAPSSMPSGRARLLAEQLPHVSAKPLGFDDEAPVAPLGSWTLLDANTLLAAPACSSPFPNGEVRLVEDRAGPPSRAYLKLWETFVRLRRRPRPGERCLDLGASPGGWTWLLANLGAHVIAVDKAPLDAAVASLPAVEWRDASAFSLCPGEWDVIDWLCSDVVAYPERLLALVERWQASGCVRNVVCTIKFQGETAHDLAERFASIPGAQVFHLHHNKHELTYTWHAPGA